MLNVLVKHVLVSCLLCRNVLYLRINTDIQRIKNKCMRFEKGWGCKWVFFKTNVTLGGILASAMEHYKGWGE